MQFGNRRLLYALSLALLFVWGCASTPYTNRQQLMLVSEAEEMRIGAAVFEQVKKDETLSTDARKNALVERVGRRIAAAAEKPGYAWEFVVLKSEQVNAFALPGGKVAVYTGILPLTGDETGLAVVMGHEVAHVLARHGAERISQQEALSVGEAALSIALLGRSPAAGRAVLEAYGLGARVGVLLPYSRTHEAEADKIGLILMARAGYDPRAAAGFWRRMSAKHKGPSPPEILSTHPSDRRRIEEIEKFMPIAMQYYEEATRQAGAGTRGR
ncbi:MAG: M48 family metallopeptidase [Thermodesulfobacteriota bacterium]